jgi:hypothetical protein
VTNRQAALIAAAACHSEGSFGVQTTAANFLEWLEAGELAELHALSLKLEAVREYASARGLVEIIALLEG